MDKLASQNKGVKYLFVAVDVFSRVVSVQTMKTKYTKVTLQAFKKIIFEKTLLKSFGLIMERNMGESTMSETKAAFAERTIQSLKHNN